MGNVPQNVPRGVPWVIPHPVPRNTGGWAGGSRWGGGGARGRCSHPVPHSPAPPPRLWRGPRCHSPCCRVTAQRGSRTARHSQVTGMGGPCCGDLGGWSPPALITSLLLAPIVALPLLWPKEGSPPPTRPCWVGTPTRPWSLQVTREAGTPSAHPARRRMRRSRTSHAAATMLGRWEGGWGGCRGWGGYVELEGLYEFGGGCMGFWGPGGTEQSQHSMGCTQAPDTAGSWVPSVRLGARGGVLTPLCISRDQRPPRQTRPPQPRCPHRTATPARAC